MRNLVVAAAIGGILAVAAPASAQSDINFDDVTAPCFFGGTSPLTSQYAGSGVTFGGNGAILHQCSNFGISARSGSNFWAFNTATYATGPAQIFFAAAQSSFSIYAFNRVLSAFTLTAYDAVNNALGSISAANTSSSYVHLNLAAEGIRSVTITTSAGDYVLDDLSSTASTVTPEPMSMALLGTGLAGLGAMRRRRRKVSDSV